MGQKVILIQGTAKTLEKHYFYCSECGAIWYEESYKAIPFSYCPTSGCMKLCSEIEETKAKVLISQCKETCTNFPNLPNEWSE